MLSLRREARAAGIDDGAASDSDDSDCASFARLSALGARQLVVKLIARNRRRANATARKSDAVSSALRALAGERGRSPCVDAILRRYPDIGEQIEQICAANDIGADAWRRDATLTIDKARKLKKGSGFRRIQLELSSRFGIDISYGAVVELGIAKSRRKRSAARYKNAVALVCRRNVKRVSEENIDKHKSAAHYQIAHYLRDLVSQLEWLWFESATTTRRCA